MLREPVCRRTMTPNKVARQIQQAGCLRIAGFLEKSNNHSPSYQLMSSFSSWGRVPSRQERNKCSRYGLSHLAVESGFNWCLSVEIGPRVLTQVNTK
jgi:hypothetical protein